ncbi:hypothetical protein E2C01_030027 [Portunus trituberculatus]|uniref:Uncharacterized protein n=1 Tax=Portunus trituberculatus TaxID=210409 RepID=A0A5B7EW69_PORTR|nr:hypothetical protein [Portunus trituberculatus]
MVAGYARQIIPESEGWWTGAGRWLTGPDTHSSRNRSRGSTTSQRLLMNAVVRHSCNYAETQAPQWSRRRVVGSLVSRGASGDGGWQGRAIIFSLMPPRAHHP